MKYPEHIQWIIDNRGEDLNEALSQDNSYKTINNPLDIFLDSDPTPKKKLTQWLVDTYINSGFRWEDIQSGSNSKVFDTLSLYVKHKSKLDSTNHIGQYDSLGSVYKDIAPFIKSDKSSRSVKRDEQARAYEESEILVKSDVLTVVVPKTEYASKWWGRGTQWCTAGDNNNVFHDYNKNGPLIIIIVNGIKKQLYVDLVNKNRYIQFMDEHDRKVDLNFIEDNWTLLSPIIEWTVKNNSKALNYIPEHLRTVELCLEAVKKDGMALEYTPTLLRTAELCLEAVKQNARALLYVPEIFKTERLFLELIRKNGRFLDKIPNNLKTVELCLEAVRQNGEALHDVPRQLRTVELCLEAVRQNGVALSAVSDNLRTAELCLEAVKQNGRALGSVPEYLRRADICLEAVKRDSYALYDVPNKLRTKELCLEAVRQNGEALCWVPDPLRTLELCLVAVRNNGIALRDCPEDLKIARLCLEAVKQDGMALRYVPKALITAKFLSYFQNKSSIEDTVKKWSYNSIDELKLKLNSNALKKINLF